MRFLGGKKLLAKHQVTVGNHLVIACFCFLSSDLSSGSLSSTGTPADLGWSRHRSLSFISNLHGFGCAQGVDFAPFKNH